MIAISWTAPKTWIASVPLDADELNEQLRDNLLETAPAKVTAAGDLVYATDANALERLGIGAEGEVLTAISGLPAWSSGLLFQRKPADESVTTSVTLQDDDHISFDIGANEVWAVTLTLWVENTLTGGFRLAFTGPSGATGYYGWYAASTSGGTAGFVDTLGTAGLIGVGFSFLLIVVEAVIVNGPNGGTVQFQWAQNSSAGTTTVKANSFWQKQKMS